MFSMINPKMLFTKEFWVWSIWFLRSSRQHLQDRQNQGMAEVFQYGLQHFKQMAKDITDDDLDKVDFSEDTLIEIFTMKNSQKADAARKEIESFKKYDERIRILEPEEYSKTFDLKGNYKIGKNTVCVDFPLQVINGLKWCTVLKEHMLKGSGFKVVKGSVTAVSHDKKKITSIEVDNGSGTEKLEFDEYVISAGIWSVGLAAQAGITLPLLAFKGHSLDVHHKSKDAYLKCAHILIPDQVAIVKMGNQEPYTRFTGYADVDGTNLNPIKARKDTLIKIAKKYFPDDYDEAKADHWVGLRPVSADDAPIIGHSTKLENLYFNTGHGCRGLAQSLGSGALLASLMQGKKAPEGMHYSLYAPSRFNV